MKNIQVTLWNKKKVDKLFIRFFLPKSHLKFIPVLCLFLTSCFHMFSDPGGHRRYEKDISKFQQSNISTEQDQKEFVANYLPLIYEELPYIGLNTYVKNPVRKGIMIDILVTYKVSNLSKEKSVYFITYLAGLSFRNSDSLDVEASKSLASVAILVNKNTNQAKIIEHSYGTYSYDQPMLLPSNEVLEYSILDNLQLILIDYKYFRGNPTSNVPNPLFWKRISKAKQSYRLPPKQVQ